MAAFDRICSGLPQLDEALDCIRLGDNVVWQTPSRRNSAPLPSPLPDRLSGTGGMSSTSASPSTCRCCG